MRLILFIFLISLNLNAQESYSSIIIGNYTTQKAISQESNKINNIIKLDQDMLEIKKSKNLIVKGTKELNKYLLEIKPFYSDISLTLFYIKIKKKYPNSFIYRYGENKISNNVKIPLLEDEIYIWYTFSFISFLIILIILIGFRENRRINKIQKEMFEKHHSLSEDQKKLLSSVGEKIHLSTKDMIQERDKILDAPVSKINKASFDSKLKSIRDVDSSLLETTNHLIEFLKIKSGKIVLKEEPFDISNLLNESANIVCKKYNDKNNIDFIYDIADNIPKILVGDAARINQILINLLENALKYTTRGEVKVEISLFEDEYKVENIRFRVSDTGLGIQKHKLIKLFEAFSYDDENTNAVEENNSLGLYITKELIAKMNGKIDATSIYGKGSTFTFYFPMIDINSIEDKSFNSLETIYKHLPKQITGKSTMVLDSNSNGSWATQHIFKIFLDNVSIQSTLSIKDNSSMISATELLVIDEKLLTQDIIEFLANIKGLTDLKVIALNNLLGENIEDENSDNLKALKAELVDRYMPKPITPSLVLELIEDIFADEIAKLLNSTDTRKSSLKVYVEDIPESLDITRERFRDFKNSKILLVEHNQINLKVLLSLLEYSGIVIIVANNGEEALKELSKYYNEFDLVLMGIDIPIIDGYTAIRKIRQNRKFDDLPIVALGGEIDDMQKCGMNALLRKPINIGILYTLFSRFLKAVVEYEDTLKFKTKAKVKTVFETIPHILDLDKGLEKAGNNEKSYAKILKEFVEIFGDSAELFSHLVEEQRYQQIKALCIDMKGMSAAIGAEDMNRLITEIYQLFMYNVTEKLVTYEDKYAKELDKLLLNIEIYLRSI